MSKENKGREFIVNKPGTKFYGPENWFELPDRRAWKVEADNTVNGLAGEWFHFVEKKDLEKCQAENERLKKQLDDKGSCYSCEHLAEQNKELERKYLGCVGIANKHAGDIIILRKQLAVAVETLKFYADENSWYYHGYDGEAGLILRDDLCDTNLSGINYYGDYDRDERPGGLSARKALRQIEEMGK